MTARRLFAQEELPFPYVPPGMEGQVKELAPWVFGTRANNSDLYSLHLFVNEALEQPVEDYLLFGHAGHGVNSWAIHYYLVYEPLAVFIQSGWGGGYMDKTETTARLAGRLTLAEQLVIASRNLRRQNRWPVSERLVVTVSDFYGSRWARLSGYPGPPGVEWSSGPDSLEQALESVVLY